MRIFQRIVLVALLSLWRAAASWDEADEEVVMLDGTSVLVSNPDPNSEWASSGSFAVGLWLRLEPKEKNDHEEMCFLSHGSWEGRFKLSLLPWRVLRFTVRNVHGGVVDCDGHTELRPHRWHHVVASYDETDAKVSLFLNGHPNTGFSCNPPSPVAAQIGRAHVELQSRP